MLRLVCELLLVAVSDPNLSWLICRIDEPGNSSRPRRRRGHQADSTPCARFFERCFGSLPARPLLHHAAGWRTKMSWTEEI